jgi:hypothetical protein
MTVTFIMFRCGQMVSRGELQPNEAIEYLFSFDASKHLDTYCRVEYNGLGVASALINPPGIHGGYAHYALHPHGRSLMDQGIIDKSWLWRFGL